MSIPVTHGLTCPACGQPTRSQFDQPSPNLPPVTCTHCTNPACPGYYRTLQIDRFYQEFAPAMSIDQDAINIIQHYYPWLTDEQARELVTAEGSIATALAEALDALEEFQRAVRDTGALADY